jgi:AcrR family transcriptional regulator
MTTRARLLQAAADVVREQGIAAASARSVAARADVNQALIFYHFGSVPALLRDACNDALDRTIESYREAFDRVTSLPQLLDLWRDLRRRELANGNVAMMGQLMAAGARDPLIGEAAKYGMDRWTEALQTVLARLLNGSVLADATDAGSLARLVSASFVGIVLYESIDDGGAAEAADALERVGVLLDAAADLGPVTRRLVRAKITDTAGRDDVDRASRRARRAARDVADSSP